jgi:thiol-disulfide isomerase/thioredoxin
MESFGIVIAIVIIILFLYGVNMCSSIFSSETPREKLLRLQPKVIILWFFRPGCGHCDRMEAAWKKFASNLPADVAVEKINVMENPDMAEDFRVEGVPHIVKVVNGKRIIYSGDRSAEDFLKFALEPEPK